MKRILRVTRKTEVRKQTLLPETIIGDKGYHGHNE
jgi:hypothetical protein